MKVAVLGSGNIGTDLVYKLDRDPELDLVLVAGVDPDSEGLARARALGYATSHHGIRGVLDHADRPDLVFDATTARAHLDHAIALADAGVLALDLTPAAVGPAVVPPVNLDEHLGAPNLNLVSCAAQATVPLVAAISSAVGGVRYAETVSTVASLSAGPGTRQNIDEFTHKTKKAIEHLGQASRGKAIIILNPADPPLIMRNTIYTLVGDEIDESAVAESVGSMAAKVQSYVPGYRVRGPVFEPGRVTVFTEVEGVGDYLPPHAGNLDIMTAAAVEVARRLVPERAAR